MKRKFKTGSVRDSRKGKGRFDLLFCEAIRLLSCHLEGGMSKYGERNWEKGQNLSSYMDSALRHAFSHLAGKRDERHDVAAAWNICAMIETKHWIDRGLLPKELDDLPRR